MHIVIQYNTAGLWYWNICNRKRKQCANSSYFTNEILWIWISSAVIKGLHPAFCYLQHHTKSNMRNCCYEQYEHLNIICWSKAMVCLCITCTTSGHWLASYTGSSSAEKLLQRRSLGTRLPIAHVLILWCINFVHLIAPLCTYLFPDSSQQNLILQVRSTK